MNPKKKALKRIKYVLDKIEELRHMNPTGKSRISTYCKKLSQSWISFSDFKSVLEKIESETDLSFDIYGRGRLGKWGGKNLDIIIKNDWKEFDEYYKSIKKEIDTDSAENNKTQDSTQKRDEKNSKKEQNKAIVNKGSNSKIQGNTIENFNIGVESLGNDSIIAGNQVSDSQSDDIKWYEKAWGKLLITIIGGVAVGIIMLVIRFYFNFLF